MRKREGLSHQRWCELIKEQAEGNQTIKAFCQARRLKEHSFYHHKRRMRPAKTATGFRQLAVPRRKALRIVICQEGSHIEVERGFDAALLRDVLAAVR